MEEIVISVAQRTLVAGTPLLLGTIGEVICERAGILNLGVEGVTISPGYSYEHAPQQEVFMHRQGSKQLFRDLFKIKKKKNIELLKNSIIIR